MTDIRRLTRAGERAMQQAAREAELLLARYPNEIVRAYAAIAVLDVILAEINDGVSREVARENLTEALKRLDGSAVLN